MRNSLELSNHEIELMVAALMSMSCALCPLHVGQGCASDQKCRKLAERIVGGDLAVVYGQGDG